MQLEKRKEKPATDLVDGRSRLRKRDPSTGDHGRAEKEETMQIGSREFETGQHTYIWGILNVTPDSFSDGGRYRQLDTALYQTEAMIREGADLIDVGGESTRPGYQQISAQEEIERVLPVLEGLKCRFDIPVSLDTSKSRVALAGIGAGVDLINDVSGLKADAKMAGVIAESGLPCCLMHQGGLGAASAGVERMAGILSDLEQILESACQSGIRKDRIILDPGIGFGKSLEENLEILHHLEVFHRLGQPLLLGASRKSVIGNTLDLPVEERLEGTLATTVLATLHRWPFVRVHDVKENKRSIRMTEAVRDCGLRG